MNDLQTLHAALAEDPSQDVIDRSRHRLQNRINGGPPKRHVNWLAVAIGVTATAAAAAVAISVLPGDTGNPPDRPDRQVRTVTGKEILLAAADAAQRAPEGSGRYWHVTISTPSLTYETWVTAEGREWFRGEKSNGEVVELMTRPNPFSLVAVDVTLEQLRALPTDPDALKAWLAEALEHSDATTSAGPLTASDREKALFESLMSLVSTLPAPPEVRAAAFRAMAAYPGVRSLGEVPGGQGLLLPGDRRFVVDPATGRVNGTSTFITSDGATYGVSDPEGARVTAEWTDALPS